MRPILIGSFSKGFLIIFSKCILIDTSSDPNSSLLWGDSNLILSFYSNPYARNFHHGNTIALLWQHYIALPLEAVYIGGTILCQFRSPIIIWPWRRVLGVNMAVLLTCERSPIPFQASHLARPTKSIMPGLSVLHGPNVACMHHTHKQLLIKSSLAGAFYKSPAWTESIASI